MTRPVEPTPAPANPRRQLWILIGAFFAPLVLAFALYYGLDIRPHGSTNQGDLIHPPISLPEVELPGVADQSFAADALRDKWSMLYIGDGSCDARCREALTLMRQTRLALGDDMHRVQRVFLVSGNCCDRAYLDSEHSGLLLGRIDNAAGQTLLETFPDASRAATLGRIYLVDPLGNLMMKYEPDAPQKGLLEDLKKLLKLSHIG